MKKILIITGGFFPGMNYGGPPVSIDNFCTLFHEYSVYIVTSDHDVNSKVRYKEIGDGWNDRGNCKVLYLSDMQYRYANFLKICRKIRPDWMYLQGLFQYCIVPCLFIARAEQIKIILAIRGELCKGAFKKKWKKIPYIKFLNYSHLLDGIEVQSTSVEETKEIKNRLRIKENHIHYLPNVPTLPKIEYVNKRKKQKGEAKLIFLSRIVSKKNLLYALKRLQNTKGKIVFDIYGTIEDKEYWNKCIKVIDKLPNNVNVNYCGIIEHEHVMETFSMYDAFLFPTLSENYGHVIVESLLSGCPVIISDQTPWTGLSQAGAGWDIRLDNESEFEDAIKWMISFDDMEMKHARQNARKFINSKLEIEDIKSAYKYVFEYL